MPNFNTSPLSQVKLNEEQKLFLSNDHLVAIGLISVQYNRMIHVMGLLIQALGRVSSVYFEIVLTKLPEKELTRVAWEYYNERFKGDIQKADKFKKLLKEVDALISKRNETIHSMMVNTLDGNKIVGLKAVKPNNGAHKVRRTEYSVDDLNKVVANFHDTNNLVLQFMQATVRAYAEERNTQSEV